MEINDVFSQVTDCINSNHLYMRLASSEMFAVSKDVVQKMIHGALDAEGAYKDFNDLLTADQTSEAADVVTEQKTGYDYTFGKNGSPAASSVINTLRKQCGSDIAIGYSSVVTASVYQGEYTRQQLNWLLANRLVMRSGRLTGKEIKTLMEWLVNVKSDGSNPVRHENLLPVTSQMAYNLTDHGDGTYTLGEICIDGSLLEENSVYTVTMFGDDSFIENSIYCNCPMPDALKDQMKIMDTNVYTLFNLALEGGNQMEAPEAYVTIQR